jgi:CheY-specific phosphatase CheX
MNVDIINAFIKACVDTFENTTQSRPFRYADFVYTEDDIVCKDELLCMLEMSGSIAGLMLFVFPNKVACNIYTAMVEQEAFEVNEEVAESFLDPLVINIAEIKSALPDLKLEFEQPESVPGGATYENSEGPSFLKIPMAFKDFGKFDVYLSLKESTG